jgi:type IV pilus assembly protein PilE
MIYKSTKMKIAPQKFGIPAHMPAFRRCNKGITLIELMIVVAIVSILAAIALPSYTEQVAKGRRAEARTQLASAQQWMERFYSEHYSYATATNNTAMTAAFATQPFVVSPRAGDGAALYNITVTATVGAFTLTAVPIAGRNMATDVCGTYTVTFTGRKSSDGEARRCF